MGKACCNLLDDTQDHIAGNLDFVPSSAIHLLFDLEKLFCVLVLNFMIREKKNPKQKKPLFALSLKKALSESDLSSLFGSDIGVAALLKI